MSLALKLKNIEQIEIKRSKRKTLGLQVYPDQRVVVRAPLRCKDSEIENFYRKNLNWIQTKLNESQRHPGLPSSEYKDQHWIWLLGDKLQIQVEYGLRSTVFVAGSQLIVVQQDISDTIHTERLVTRWKRDFAADYFQQTLSRSVHLFPINLPNFTFKLRKMKRQWGNCNSKKLITMNLQLIRYPIECIEYVAVHELTHLKVMNHGKSFYGLLEKVLPNWKESKQLLSQFSDQ